MPKIVLYYKKTCAFCQKVLKYLARRDIYITTTDITVTSANREELIALAGKSQVPCLIVDGQIIHESDLIIDWFDKHWKELKKNDAG